MATNPVGVIDPLVPLHPSGKLRNGGYNFSWNTALYTRAIAYSLREFGQVKVMCSTIHVSDQVARSRIANAAYRLGVKVTTKVYRAYPETDYVIGTVIGSKKMEPDRTRYKKYRVAAYIRVDGDDCDLTFEEAESEKAHMETLQPENIYRIECEDTWPTCCEDRENQRLDVATGRLDCVSCGADLGPVEEKLAKALRPFSKGRGKVL